MLKDIKKSAVKDLLPRRLLNSHKGENGKVLIVGGSIDYHGAPILSGLGALNSGADLVYLYVPECNFECSRSMYPDFIVKKYPGDFLTERYVNQIVEFGKKCGSILIGPGLGEREQTQNAVLEIVKNLHIPTVLDAEAMMVLKRIEKFPLAQPLAITPHAHEFQTLIEREMKIVENDAKSIVLLRSIAMDLHLSILLKGPVDFVASEEGDVELNRTGNPGMTVGGTGDVLAGMLASFMARGADPFDAARCAAYYNGVAGDLLKERKNYNFTASELAMTLAYAIPAV